MDQHTTTFAPSGGPELALARTFLGGLVQQDFRAVADAMAPAVHLRALLPAGLFEWTGSDVPDRFERWFGNTESFASVDAAAGTLGGRVHLRWRFRLRAERLGPGPFVVAQAGYADVDESAGIVRLDLVCTGFLPEVTGG